MLHDNVGTVTAHRKPRLAAGMDDYVTKPIRVDALIAALNNTPARKE